MSWGKSYAKVILPLVEHEMIVWLVRWQAWLRYAKKQGPIRVYCSDMKLLTACQHWSHPWHLSLIRLNYYYTQTSIIMVNQTGQAFWTCHVTISTTSSWLSLYDLQQLIIILAVADFSQGCQIFWTRSSHTHTVRKEPKWQISSQTLCLRFHVYVTMFTQP